MHRIDTRFGPSCFDEEGTTAGHNVYDNGLFLVTAIRNVVQSFTIQFENDRALPLQREQFGNLTLKKKDAEAIAMRHVPNDRKKVRTFRAWNGLISVFFSPTLAKRVPDPVWYQCQPVGTFQVVLQQIEGDSGYFGALIGTGVDYDENDPGRRDDC
jgi:hypothetical protein